MNAIKWLDLLDEALCGVYAVDAEQKIVYWNSAAERILGYKREDISGLRCYEVCASLPPNGTAPICIEGCPSLILASQGIKPPVIRVRMRHSSGERKPVSVVPLIIQAGHEDDQTVIVHLFHERVDDTQAEKMAESVRSLIAPDDGRQALTPKELQTLRLVAQSLDVPEIADQMGISAHTVWDHIRNVRMKLNAKDRLEAVLVAQRNGLL